VAETYNGMGAGNRKKGTRMISFAQGIEIAYNQTAAGLPSRATGMRLRSRVSPQSG